MSQYPKELDDHTYSDDCSCHWCSAVRQLNREKAALSERVVEVEAKLGIALNEYACFLERLTAINQHGGYQFTQLLMSARDCLNWMKAKLTRQTSINYGDTNLLPTGPFDPSKVKVVVHPAPAVQVYTCMDCVRRGQECTHKPLAPPTQTTQMEDLCPHCRSPRCHSHRTQAVTETKENPIDHLDRCIEIGCKTCNEIMEGQAVQEPETTISKNTLKGKDTFLERLVRPGVQEHVEELEARIAALENQMFQTTNAAMKIQAQFEGAAKIAEDRDKELDRFRAALETIATPMQQHDGFTCHSLKPRN